MAFNETPYLVKAGNPLRNTLKTTTLPPLSTINSDGRADASGIITPKEKWSMVNDGRSDNVDKPEWSMINDGRSDNKNIGNGVAGYKDADRLNDRRVAAKMAEEAFKLKMSTEAGNADRKKFNKFRLVNNASYGVRGLQDMTLEQVQFELSPEISESKQANYAQIDEIRQAASILIYSGSPSRNWSVSAKFLSRTVDEATTTWKNIQLLKAWHNPDTNYYNGYDSGTPYILRMYGYGETWQGIPVVLKSLTVEYPTDVDYIPNINGTNVPVIQSVNFSLTEARTPAELTRGDFDLEKFKLGVLKHW